MRMCVLPKGTSVTGTASPQAPACAHAGLAGGISAAFVTTGQLVTGRAMPVIVTGITVEEKGCELGADTVLKVSEAPGFARSTTSASAQGCVGVTARSWLLKACCPVTDMFWPIQAEKTSAPRTTATAPLAYVSSRICGLKASAKVVAEPPTVDAGYCAGIGIRP